MHTTSTHAETRRRHAVRVRGERERGSTSVQMVILMPVLFGIMFLGMQAALFYHARTLAIAAAQEGARTAAGVNSSIGAGLQTASGFVARSGGDGVLRGARASGSRTADTATVQITGTSPSVIPGWSPSVTQQSSAPVEKLTG